jgi:hypothetical protein
MILFIGISLYVVESMMLDSKAESRLKRYRMSCLICLKTQKDLHVMDMKSHIKNKHNIWSYMDYFVYLREKTRHTPTEANIAKWIR